MLLLNLHAPKKNCAALLLLVTYLCGMLYFYDLPLVVGLPPLLLVLLSSVRVFFCRLCSSLHVYPVLLLFFLFILVLLPFILFYTYRVPAQSGHMTMYAYCNGYCLLSVVLLVLPSLQHAVWC